MKISIDGNIGSGKSALIQHLQDVFSSRDDIEFFPEPIDEWMPLFQMYMTNKKRYAPLFTLEVLRSFGRVKYSTRRHQIIERHPCTTMHVFNNILKNDGHIQSDDLGLIEDYYDLFGWVPDMILYIQVDDTTCIDRIEHRGRQGEENITYSDVRAISYHHDKMYSGPLKHVQMFRCIQSDSETKEQFHARIATLVSKTLQDDDKKNCLHDNK